MKVSLSSICEYRKAKVSVLSLNVDSYISTENMLPDKGGVTAATALPHISQTQAYFKDDVLISKSDHILRKSGRHRLTEAVLMMCLFFAQRTK